MFSDFFWGKFHQSGTSRTRNQSPKQLSHLDMKMLGHQTSKIDKTVQLVWRVSRKFRKEKFFKRHRKIHHNISRKMSTRHKTNFNNPSPGSAECSVACQVVCLMASVPLETLNQLSTHLQFAHRMYTTGILLVIKTLAFQRSTRIWVHMNIFKGWTKCIQVAKFRQKDGATSRNLHWIGGNSTESFESFHSPASMEPRVHASAKIDIDLETFIGPVWKSIGHRRKLQLCLVQTPGRSAVSWQEMVHKSRFETEGFNRLRLLGYLATLSMMLCWVRAGCQKVAGLGTCFFVCQCPVIEP